MLAKLDTITYYAVKSIFWSDYRDPPLYSCWPTWSVFSLLPDQTYRDWSNWFWHFIVYRFNWNMVMFNTWTVNFLMFKPVLEKAEEPEIKLPISTGSRKKQESSRKTSISALMTMAKRLTVWITINCGKFWERWEYQTTWPASWETCMQVRKQQLELDMEQQTGSK